MISLLIQILCDPNKINKKFWGIYVFGKNTSDHSLHLNVTYIPGFSKVSTSSFTLTHFLIRYMSFFIISIVNCNIKKFFFSFSERIGLLLLTDISCLIFFSNPFKAESKAKFKLTILYYRQWIIWMLVFLQKFNSTTGWFVINELRTNFIHIYQRYSRKILHFLLKNQILETS